MPGKHSDFSQFSGPGRKYAQAGKERRTPRRDRQVARGVGMPSKGRSSEPDYVRSARRAMGRGRVGKQYGK